MFENALLASSILCLVCAVIVAGAGIIWARMAMGGKKKTDNKNIKERANAAVAADKAEESKAEEPVVAEESEDAVEYHNYHTEDKTDTEVTEPETEDETDAKKEFETPSIEEVETTEAETDAEETETDAEEASETEEVEKTETEE